MQFRCVFKNFDALVLDSNFTHVHHLRSMTREGETKFLMGKLKSIWYRSKRRWKIHLDGNFDCHDQYFNGPCVNGSYYNWKYDKEHVRIFNPSTRKMVVLPYQRKYSRLVESSFYYSLGYEPSEGQNSIARLLGCFTGQNDLDVDDISKPKYCPPQEFYYYHNGEIIFIAIKNNVLFYNFYDVEKIVGDIWKFMELQ
ncbi:hypothetical protein H5410_048959 [Solanum commersonii]|uniref:Uncharacterized protein n=1 Tax=Solanum commersonii TaxID=4109 RepID=A0A9J5XL15_SOLCO|nr:hypothetical protein H5410_048959 [Solanum commersonii]